jgi:transposase-like protein
LRQARYGLTTREQEELRRLRRENARLKQYKEIPRKAAVFFAREEIRCAFVFIEAERASHPISAMCRMLGVSRSGYHAWRRRPQSDRQLSDAWLRERIRQIHSANHGVYESPRVHAELRLACGIRVGRKRLSG